MRSFLTSPYEMFACLWRNRELLIASVKREVLGRYKGSVIGILWPFLNPLLMLVVYTFVFSVIFKARWGASESESKIEFALILFSGLMIFSFFSECINRATGLILNNSNYVKKIIFPLEILPAVSMGAATFHMFISLVAWLLVYILFFGIPHVTIILLPIIIFPLMMLIMGFSWILSSICVYLRDVSQMVGIITSVMMFLSPIFYPVSALSEKYRYIIYLNPLTTVIEMTRDILFFGKIPNLLLLTIYWIVAALIAWIGFVWFQKTRKGFADVL